MQMVRPIVGGQDVVLAVEREAALGDAVGKPSSDAPEERMPLEIPSQSIEAQHHIPELSMTVSGMQFGHQQAVVGEFQRRAVGVAKYKKVGFAAIGQRTKDGAVGGHGRIGRLEEKNGRISRPRSIPHPGKTRVRAESWRKKRPESSWVRDSGPSAATPTGSPAISG